MAATPHDFESPKSLLSRDKNGEIKSPRDGNGDIIPFHLREPEVPIIDLINSPGGEKIKSTPQVRFEQPAIDGLGIVTRARQET
jgi:hypothetical protein